MKRWHDEAHITRRHHHEHLRLIHGWPGKPVDCVCDLQAGRFRKRYGLGCPGCRLCKRYKYAGVPWHRFARSALAYRQQLADRPAGPRSDR